MPLQSASSDSPSLLSGEGGRRVRFLNLLHDVQDDASSTADTLFVLACVLAGRDRHGYRPQPKCAKDDLKCIGRAAHVEHGGGSITLARNYPGIGAGSESAGTQ